MSGPHPARPGGPDSVDPARHPGALQALCDYHREPEFYDRLGGPVTGPQHGSGLVVNRIPIEDIFYKGFSL